MMQLYAGHCCASVVKGMAKTQRTINSPRNPCTITAYKRAQSNFLMFGWSHTAVSKCIQHCTNIQDMCVAYSLLNQLYAFKLLSFFTKSIVNTHKWKKNNDKEGDMVHTQGHRK